MWKLEAAVLLSLMKKAVHPILAYHDNNNNHNNNCYCYYDYYYLSSTDMLFNILSRNGMFNQKCSSDTRNSLAMITQRLRSDVHL